jgi:hypothetical protein
MTSFKLLAVGLPSAGKTTFLAALWSALESPEQTSHLTLADLQGDRTYVNSIRDRWLSCVEVNRTALGAQPVSLRLRRGTGVFEVAFPDHSGELFRDALEHRSWPPPLGETVRCADAVLLFVSPLDLHEPATVSEAAELIEAVGAEPFIATELVPFDRRRVPTQVNLVDLLQALVATCERTPRIALIVSAWDSVAGQATPGEWLSQRLPLLAQYLAHCPELNEVGIWGVSAQGGDYSRCREALLAHDEPSTRVLVVGQSVRSTDITLPILRLLDDLE